MSDPAKSPEEIEDVLASIRRLVSDHGTGSGAAAQPAAPSAAHRGAHGGRNAGARPTMDNPVTRPAQAEALVLTPSFRVADPDDPWAPVSRASTPPMPDPVPDPVPGAQSGDHPVDDISTAIADVVAAAQEAGQSEATSETTADASTAEQGADWRLDDRLARFDVVGNEAEPSGEHPAEDAAVAAAEATDFQSADIEAPDTAERTDDISDEDLSDLLRLDGARPDADMFGTEQGEFESETGDENWPGDGAEAALLSLVARRDPGHENTQDTDQPSAPDDDIAALDEMSPPDTGLDAGEPVSGEPDLPTEMTKEPCAADAELDEADHNLGVDALAGMASSDAPADEQDVPPPAGDDHEPDHTPPIFSRRAQAAANPQAANPQAANSRTAAEDVDADIEDLGAEPSPFSFPDPEDSILDEDTLREIIVDVVREELQGVLGQRITRNVRKMVRREIRLALAAEDLE